MIIGLCGAEFPEVGRAVSAALPDAELVTVGPGADGRHVDVVVPLGGTVDAALMDATRPRLIQQFGVGLQGVDLAAARTRGIPVANVPAAGTGNEVAVAEVALLHLLALLRRLPQARRSVRQRRVGEPIGGTLAGRTVTVLGVGAIGTAVAERLTALAAVPVGVGRRQRSEAFPADRYHPVGELTTALARSHAVVVCLPLTEETTGMVGERELAAMPPGGHLVNVGRGPVVDYRALLDALRSGHLAGAGLDVAWREPIDPDDPLLAENVTVTPHIGGITVESYTAMADAFAANVECLRTGRPLAHRAA